MFIPPARIACVLPTSLSGFRLHHQPDYVIISNLPNVNALLRQAGIDSRLFDCLAEEGRELDSVLSAIARFDPDFLVICAHFSLEDLEGFLDRLFPRVGKRIPVICFGTGVIDHALALERIESVEAVIPCFSEQAVVEWILARTSGGAATIDGVATRDGLFRKRRLESLDDLLRYTPLDSFISRTDPEMAYLWSSRGCWYGRCTFCNVGAISGHQESGWNARPAASVVADVVSLRAKGVRKIHFLDSEFIGGTRESKRRAMEIADSLIDRNVGCRFIFDCRIDNVEEELFSRLKQAGLANVFIGIESGSESALRRLKKGYTVERVERGIKVLRKLGIRFKTNFILADPGSTIDEVEESLDFIKKWSLLDTLRPCGIGSPFHRLHLHAGTELYSKVAAAEGSSESEIACRYNDPQVASFIESAVTIDNCLMKMISMSHAHLKEAHRITGHSNYVKAIGFNALRETARRVKIHGNDDGLIERLERIKKSDARMWAFAWTGVR